MPPKVGRMPVGLEVAPEGLLVVPEGLLVAPEGLYPWAEMLGDPVVRAMGPQQGAREEVSQVL